MEPIEPNELNDHELSQMLREWEAPEPPDRLRGAIFGERPNPWWRRMWRVRVPLPVACALLLVVGLVVWRWMPRVVVQTKTVEVPVVQERIVYRDRAAVPAGWRPVAELRPRIIRSQNHEN
jgi:hypothetical protein